MIGFLWVRFEVLMADAAYLRPSQDILAGNPMKTYITPTSL